MISEFIIVCSGLTLLVAGLAAIAATRNMVKIVMGLQAMILGSLLLLSLACSANNVSSEDMFILLASATAATEALSMAIILLVWERFKTINPQDVSELRW